MTTNDVKELGLKFQRTLTAFLPQDRNRKGACLKCGRCCQFVFKCPFYDGERCIVYSFRPLQCRKYPRTQEESLVPGCGFSFGE